MQAARRVLKNTGFLYMKMGITVFSSLYATRLVLNALGASDFGIFALIMGLIGMFMFLNAAMSQSTQRFMSYAQGKKDFQEEKSVFSISVIIHFVIAAVLVLLLYSFESYLFDHLLTIDAQRIETAKIIYTYMLFGTFFMIVSVPYDAVINAHEDMLFFAILGILESFLKLGIAIYVTFADSDKLIVYGFLMAFLSFVMTALKAMYSHKKYPEVQVSILKDFDAQLFKKMFSFAGYTFINVSTQMLANYGQSVVLNMFFGTIVNAAQGIATQVSAQLAMFASTMLRALNPMIVKSEGAGNRQLMLDASFVGIKISFYLLMFFYIPVLLEMDAILNLWLVEVPEFTIIFCTLLLIRNLIEQLYVTLNSSIMSVGNIKMFQIVNSVWNLFPLPAAYVLFKMGFPPTATYVVFIIYSFIQGGIYIAYAKKECAMSLRAYFNNVIVKSLVPFIIVFALVSIPHFLIENEVYRIISVLFFNVIIFILVVWRLGLSEIEKEFIKKLVRDFRLK